MRVTFWGVRGTFPAVGGAFARYGGDTMCVEAACGDTRLILDAGSGLRALGARLNAAKGPLAAHIVLSHLHLDHVIGLTAFAPFWRRDARIHLHAAEECLAVDREALFSVIRPPLFPLDAGAAPASIGLEEFRLGGAFIPGPGVVVRTVALNHQGPCAAIIVHWGGRKLCYVTDHEHGDAVADRVLAHELKNADLLIYDATYTDAEMDLHRGWGHSSWEEGLRLKRRAGVRLLALAHHEPDRTDAALDRLAEAASAQCDNVLFARQGLSLTL
jgi:phosphoribosyl 1,2-cyclic phosphodiesterase